MRGSDHEKRGKPLLNPDEVFSERELQEKVVMWKALVDLFQEGIKIAEERIGRS